MTSVRQGPLKGFRVVEFGGIGPGPFCAMLLADLGAEVIRIDRPDGEKFSAQSADRNPLYRGRRSIVLDMKDRDDREAAMLLIETTDMLIEGFRPGVMERLGLGPDDCVARNPRLIYGRITGFGQHGPLAHAAGHDIAYIALAGALHAIGRAGERPVPPLNLVGDFGGGALYLALGLLAALLERERSGVGQVVDAAMIDGAASLMTPFYGALETGAWNDRRGANILDGGSPFYDTYETSDSGHVAVGALEPRFFAELASRIGLDATWAERRNDRGTWPKLRAEMTRLFAGRTRAEWVLLLEGSDACAVGVYSLREAPAHPHNIARDTFIEIDGIVQPAPAPRFSRTPAARPTPPPIIGRDTNDVLRELGVDRSAFGRGERI
jgi:alpha-methylacyl-CoA racemase